MPPAIPRRICRLAPLVLAALASPAPAADYEVQPIAFTLTFTPNPTDTSRMFDPPVINNSGDVLFGGHWLDMAWQHNVLSIGRPGSLGRIAAGGEAPPGNIANAKFSGGVGSRFSNFNTYAFNAQGEFLFFGTLISVNPTLPPPIPGGLWKGRRGDFGLLPPPIGNLPYAGSGRLEWDLAPGIIPGGVSDDGPGYFIGTLVAVEEFGRRVPVIQGGVFTAAFANRAIAYPGGPAPGLGGDYVFRSVGPVMMGQKNGALAMLTTVILRGEPNPTVNSRVIYYEYRDNELRPFYINGDPLPGLAGGSPSATLVAIDEIGNALLLASAAGAQGLWRHTAAGFSKILLFNEDTPTPAGPARFFAPGSLSSFAMGGGRVAMIGSFTGVGVPNPRPAIVRETDTGFEIVATGNQPVPGTDQVFIDFANQSSFIWMNANREVAFFAGAREPTSVTTRRTLFVAGRDGLVRRAAYPPMQFTLGGIPRTVASVGSALGSARVLADSGAVALLLNFTDGTTAVARAVPPGYQDPAPPPPALDDYYFNGRNGPNWHASPLTNWEDSSRRATPQVPGDGSPNRAAVFIPANFSVVLDQKPAPIGSIRSDGALAVSQPLTLNFGSSFNVLNVLGPSGGLTVRDSIVSANSTNWNAGTLALASSTFRNLGNFAPQTGAITGTATALGNASTFENRGTLEKRGVGEFTVQVPFVATSPAAADGIGLRVSQGTLGLLGGGSFAGPLTGIVARGTTLRLAGAYSFSGNTTFTGIGTGPAQAGTLDLGTATADATLTLAPGANLTLDLDAQTTRFNRGALESGVDSAVINQGRMVWAAGRIGTNLRNRRLLEIEPGPVPRVVARAIFNRDPIGGQEPTVTQLASFRLEGFVNNLGRWHITRSAEIDGDGEFYNRGICIIDLAQPGAVDIRAAFTNQELGFSTSNTGTLFVGSSVLNPQRSQTHAPANVRLHGRVRELEGGVLQRSRWFVESGCTLTFPSSIEELGTAAEVLLRGGSIPSLQLRQNSGFLTYEDASGSTPGGFRNLGFLTLLGRSTLTVGGDFVTSLSFECTAGSRLVVNGHYRQEAGGVINDGEVVATRSITIGRSRGGGTYIPGEGFAVNFIEEAAVFSSPGTLNVRGAAAFAPTAALEIELAGTAAQRFDVLAVTRTVTLGGTLRIALIENFSPAPGDSFAVVQAGAIAGQFLNVRSGQRLPTTDGRGSFEVHYGAGSPRNPNHVVLANWQPSPAGFPLVSAAPASQTIATGDAAVLRVTATAAGALTYQWRLRGADIPGATNATFTVPSVQPEHAGSYSVAVTNALGTTVTTAAGLTLAPPPPSAARLLNVSTRALARPGDGALIPGFLLRGEQSARLLIRAVGPQLAGFGVSGTLPNPQMIVNRLAGAAYVDLAANNDWGANANAPAIAAAAATVGAFPLNAGGLDSALLLDLAPGQYTVIANDTADRSGVGIVELYDLGGSAARARLANISTRAFVGAGADVMIPGFVISPEGSKTLLIRAVGPTLAAFGVGDTLADPQFTLFQRQPGGADIPILTNNDWGAAFDPAQTAEVAAQVGAFPLAAGGRDAALVATLPPGAYTVQISGVGGATGNALVEVYEVR